VLQWGRVHLADQTLVFNSIALASGETWARARRWSDGGTSEFTAFMIERSTRGVDVVLPGQSPVRLEPHRTLHAGDPIDRARFPNLIERLASSVLTGRAEEERRFDRARSLGNYGAAGWAIHEQVRFGKAIVGAS
jgi:hypothetical protein